MRTPLLRLIAITGLAAMFASPAFAACTSPAGVEGDVVYNDDYDAVQVCTGSNVWIKLGGATTDARIGTLTANKWCAANAGGTGIDCTQNAPSGTLSGGTSGYLGVWTGATTLGLSSTTAGQQLFWDSTNNRLGIGTAAPADILDLVRASGNRSQIHILQSSVSEGGIGFKASDSSLYITNEYGLGAGGLGTAAQSLTLTSSGNVGIGTASPSAPLEVAGTATGSNHLINSTNSGSGPFVGLFRGMAPNLTAGQSSYLAFGKADSNYDRGYMSFNFAATGSTSNSINFGFYGANNLVSILGSGNVGIGTTAPSVRFGQKLDVATIGTWGGQALTTFSNTGIDHSSALDFNRSRAATAVQGVVNSTDALGYITFRGSDGTNFVNAAQIGSWVDGTVATNPVPGRLFFRTADSAGAMQDRMNITSAGNVGIGTTAPAGPLHVAGSNSSTGPNAATAIFLQNTDATANNTATLAFNTVDSGGSTRIQPAWISAIFNNRATGTGNGQLLFWTANAAATPTERMRIDASGNVGIGTTAPQAGLDVYNSGTVLAGIKLSAQLTDSTAMAAGVGGALGFSGQDGTGVARYAAIGGYKTNGTSGDDNGYLSLYSRGSGNLIERMRIDNAGNVGIGTTSPTARLEVAGSVTLGSGATLGTSAGDLNLATAGTARGVLSNTTGTLNINRGFFTSQGIFSDPGTGVSFDYAASSGGARMISDTGYNFYSNNGATSALYISTAGNVGIGTTTPATNAMLTIMAQTAGAGFPQLVLLAGSKTWRLTNDGGSFVIDDGTGGTFGSGVWVASGGSSWSALSDVRLKTDIKPIESALDKLTRIHGVTFHWKDPDRHGEEIGVIAQDVEKVFPQLVSSREGYKGVNYSGLTAPLIEAVRELKADNDNLRHIVEEQGEEIRELKAKIH